MENNPSNPFVAFMMQQDAFSRWLGIEILETRAGYCRLQMLVREEMMNGFGIAHGGICFSLADTCLAFAANSYGKLSLTLNADISWPESLFAGDTIVAESVESYLSERAAIYDVSVRKAGQPNPVALFRGMVHRTSKPVLPNQ